MNRIGMLVLALSTLAISACDSQKVEESPMGNAMMDEVRPHEAAVAPTSRRVREADCLNELLPSIGLGNDFSIVRVGDTNAGCEIAGNGSQAAEEVIGTLSDALSSKGYALQDSVGAKGGTRLTLVSPDGLAVSALIRGAAVGDSGEGGVQSSRVDLHWYAPDRLKD